MTNKKYAVVCFEDNSFSEIPTGWLCDNDEYCWWPNTKNVSSFITKESEPIVGKWTKHKVKIQEYCDTLEKARKRADDISCTDSENMESQVRTKRKRKQRYITAQNEDAESSDSSESSIIKKRTLPPAPKLPIEAVVGSDGNLLVPLHIFDKDNNTTQATSFTRTGVELCETVFSDTTLATPRGASCSRNRSNFASTSGLTDDFSYFETDPLATPLTTPCSSIRSNKASTSNTIKNIDSDPLVITYLKRIMASVAEIKMDLKDLKSNKTPESQDYGDILEYFPINSKEKFDEFNIFITDEIKKEKFAIYIKTIGGNGVKDNLYRILKTIFSNEFAVMCSWLGLRNNFKLEGTNIMNVLKDYAVTVLAVQQKIFENITAEWFRQAQQRYKRQK